MAWTGWAILFGGAWLAWCFASRALLRGPRPTPLAGLIWWTMRAHARLVLRLRVSGREHIPDPRERGIIVVANHSAGVDPLLVQLSLPFEVRWIMASDMRVAALEPAWQWLGIIFVDRTGRTDPGSLREAIRHVRGGGALGIFPEGGIARPPRHLLVFQPGLGLIARRTRAPILPVVIEGTPVTDNPWASLVRRSRARVTIHEPVEYPATLKPEEIARDLRERFHAWTGWPLADAQPRPDATYY